MSKKITTAAGTLRGRPHERQVAAGLDSAPERIVREAECKQLTGLTRSTRWRLERQGKFPKRVILGDNSIGWHLGEILGWLRDRPVRYPTKPTSAGVEAA